MLRILSHCISSLLIGEARTKEVKLKIPIINDEVEIPSPVHDEVSLALKRLKNNKTPSGDGILDEKFKNND